MIKRRQVFAVLMCVILMSACTGKKVETAIEAPEPVKVVQENTEVETVKSEVSEQELATITEQVTQPPTKDQVEVKEVKQEPLPPVAPVIETVELQKAPTEEAKYEVVQQGESQQTENQQEVDQRAESQQEVIVSVMEDEKAVEVPPQEIPQNTEQEVKKTLEINIIIQGQTFNITLEDNKTATAFIDMLPMTINMTDVNRNEKYYVLPETIRKEASEKVGTIQTGDLMCYGDAGLVLFYESFSTPYSYVPIGHMTDITGFVKALGTGEASVTLSLKADSTN